jgi:hypothetical protein
MRLIRKTLGRLVPELLAAALRNQGEPGRREFGCFWAYRRFSSIEARDPFD